MLLNFLIRKKRNKLRTVSEIQMKLSRFRRLSKSAKNLQANENNDKIPIQGLKKSQLDPRNGLYLSPEETKNIQDTLPYVTMHMHEILNEAFINLFALNPDIKDKFFTFKDSTPEDLKCDQEQQGDDSFALQRHIPRVGRALTKILSKVDDLSSVLDYLQILGKIHHQNGIQVSKLSSSTKEKMITI